MEMSLDFPAARTIASALADLELTPVLDRAVAAATRVFETLPHGIAVIGRGAGSQGFEVAIAFVDEHEIRALDDAALDALQFIACIGQHQHQKKIHHAGNFVFRLSNADSFHQDFLD